MSSAFELLKTEEVCKAARTNPTAEKGEFVVLNDSEELPRGKVEVDGRISCCAVSRGFLETNQIDYHAFTSRNDPYEIISGDKFSSIGTALLPIRLHGTLVIWYVRAKVMPYSNLQRFDFCGKAGEEDQFDLVLGRSFLEAEAIETNPERMCELDEREMDRIENNEKSAEEFHDLRIRAVNI